MNLALVLLCVVCMKRPRGLGKSVGRGPCDDAIPTGERGNASDFLLLFFHGRADAII